MEKLLEPLKSKVTFYVIVFFILFSGISFAGDVLQWDRNDDADYYVVYWGRSAGDYSEGSSPEIPGFMTELPLEESDDGETYYYAVKAFNQCGNSSDYSDEVKTAHRPNFDSLIEYTSRKSVRMGEIGAGFESEGGGCFVESVF